MAVDYDRHTQPTQRTRAYCSDAICLSHIGQTRRSADRLRLLGFCGCRFPLRNRCHCEREFLRSLSNVIPAVAVLLIAIPGELQGPQDTTKVMEYVRGLVEDHGFPGTRFAGAWLWWIDGDLHNSDSAIRNPGELISRRDISNDQVRDSLIRSSVVRLLHKIKQKAESIGVKPLPQLSDEELRTLDADLLIRLERVKTLADERFRDAPSLTDNEARSFVKNEILGWESSKNLYAGSWLRYVETVRPGTITGLFQHLETVLSTLTVRPSTTQSSESVHTTSSLSRLRHYLILHLAGEKAIHVSFSLLVGVALWYLTLAQAYSGISLHWQLQVGHWQRSSLENQLPHLS